MYWAPEAAASNASHTSGNFSAPPVKRGLVTAVEDGFTFTSPSVYIVYSSIHASASCIAMTQTYHTVGGTHVTTRAYDPDALSTVRCVNSIGVGKDQHSVIWEAINYDDLYYPIPMSASYSRIDRCFTDRKDNDVWGDWMRKPFISLPQDVSEFDPAWSTCSGVKIGAMDPPRALVPAAGFDDPPPTKPDDPQSAGPITKEPPSLPKATPGKTVPESGPEPTGQPRKGTPPTTPMPDPGSGPAKDADSLPHDPPSDPSKASSVGREPSKSPAAPAPQPQQPSPDPPRSENGIDPEVDPMPGVGSRLPVQDNKPTPEQPQGKETEGQPDGSVDFDPISSALFGGGPSDIPNTGDKTPGNVNKDGNPDQQVSAPKENTGTTSKAAQNDPQYKTPAQAETGPNKNKGSSDTESPPTNNGHNSPDTSDDPPTVAPAKADESNDIFKPGNGGGSKAGSAGGNRDHQGSETKSRKKDKSQSQESDSPVGKSDNSAVPNKKAKAEKQAQSSPSTFAFVSNQPPPIQGSHTIMRAADGAAIIGTVTIHPSQGQTVHGTPISVAPNAVVVGGSSFAFDSAPNPQMSAVTPIIQQGPNGGLVIGSKTIMPGNAGFVNEHQVSVGSSNVVIDGSSFAFPAATSSPASYPINVGGVPIAPGLHNAVVIGSLTYEPGARLTESGHTVSVGSGTVAVDGTLHIVPTPPASSLLQIEGNTVRKDPSGNIMVGSSTVKPGGKANIAGHTISVAAADDNIIIDHNTYALSKSPGPVQIPSSPSMTGSPLIIDGETVRKNPGGDIVIGSSTITQGSQVTIAGHTLSAGFSNLFFDGKTYAMPISAGPVIESSTVTSPPPQSTSLSRFVFTIGDQVFTAQPTGFALAGTSVALNGPGVAISGTVVSLGTAGLVIGSKTMALPSVVVEATGPGDAIMSTFGSTGATGAGGVHILTPTPTPTGSGGNVTAFVPDSQAGFGTSVSIVLIIGLAAGIIGVVF